MKKKLARTLWRSKASVFACVVVATVVGASSATAHTADRAMFHLGHSNTANAWSMLSANVADRAALYLTNTNTAAGSTALELRVAPGHGPLRVYSSTKVTNLNADQLDGKDSSAFLGKTEKAADSDKLDGLDSSAFLDSNNMYALISANGTLVRGIDVVAVYKYVNDDNCVEGCYEVVFDRDISKCTYLATSSGLQPARPHFLTPYDIAVAPLSTDSRGVAVRVGHDGEFFGSGVKVPFYIGVFC